MGGPCMCGGTAITAGTDNFELAPFDMGGVRFWSAEQAYQALKMRRAADRSKIGQCTPKKGERGWDHGWHRW